MRALERLFVLAVLSLVCGIVAGVAALYAFGKALPPTDGAYGMSVWESLGDPFVFAVWYPLVLIGSAIGFLPASWLLWRVDLSKAAPVVVMSTIAFAALSALVYAPASPLFGAGAGVGAMLWCRKRPGWRCDAGRCAERGPNAADR